MPARLAIRCDKSPHGDLPATSPLFSDLPDDMKPVRDTVSTSVRKLSNVGSDEEERAASLHIEEVAALDLDECLKVREFQPAEPRSRELW